MKHRDYIILQKICAEIDVANELLGEMPLSVFESDEKTKRAVCMTVINIGELVKNVTDETRNRYPDMPWKAAAGFRDIAAHKYQTLHIGDVYSTVKDDFPIFKKQITDVLDANTDEYI